MELNPTVHKREFGIKGYFVWNIKSIKSVAWLWAATISISLAVKDNGVILEALPGVSPFPYTVLVSSYSALIMLFMKRENVSILLLWLYCC